MNTVENRKEMTSVLHRHIAIGDGSMEKKVLNAMDEWGQIYANKKYPESIREEDRAAIKADLMNIIKDNITFVAQVGGFVVHGAIDKILEYFAPVFYNQCPDASAQFKQHSTPATVEDENINMNGYKIPNDCTAGIYCNHPKCYCSLSDKEREDLLIQQAAKQYANERHGFDGSIAPIGSKHRAEWENTVDDFIAGHSHKGEGWVSVETLPEGDEIFTGLSIDVLICNSSGDIGITCYDFKNDKWINTNRCKNPTHYMLLPQPPKTDKT